MKRLNRLQAALVGLGLFALLTPVGAHADVPPYVPVQGFLADADDVPLSGDLQIRFRLYASDDASGTPVHEETQTVAVESGHFTVYLGDGAALAPAVFRDNSELYVGLKVEDDDEMTPLLRLATAPFAGFAQYCGEAVSVGGLATADLQRRVADACPSGNSIQAIDADGNVTCVAVGAVSAVNAGAGLSGGGSGAVSLSVDTTTIQARVVGTCAASQAMQSIAANGTVVCADLAQDSVTAVNAGAGLAGGGGPGAISLSVDTTTIQARVTDTCSATEAIRAIGDDGSVTCASIPQGDITAVTAGFGLSGGAASGSASLAVNVSAFNVAPTFTSGHATRTVTTTSDTTIDSASITVPTSGTVLAIATGSVVNNSGVAGDLSANIGFVDTASGSPTINNSVFVFTNAAMLRDVYAVQGRFTVTAGTHTFYLRGYLSVAGTMNFFRNQISLIFIPH